MMTDRKRMLQDVLWNLLAATLCGWGVACVSCGALLGAGQEGMMLLVCAATVLVLTLAFDVGGSRAGLAAIGIFFVMEGVLFAAGRGQMYLTVSGLKALYLQLTGVTGATLPYADVLRRSLTGMFAFIAYVCVREASFSMAAGAMLTLLASSLVAGEGQGAVYVLPVMAGLTLTLSGAREKSLKALPVAALIAALAFVLLPPRGAGDPALQQTAQDVRDAAEDYLFFTEERRSFSLADEGYMPLQDRLGGTANPLREKVLEVNGTPGATVYLRGTIMNEYTGLNWYDTLSDRRYLYAGRRDADMRRDVFQEAYLTGETSRVSVHMLSDGATTLFVPQRLRALTTLEKRMVPYFNRGSEVFITRNTAAGDRYEAEYLPLTLGSGAVRAALNDGDEAGYQAAVRDYTGVPDHMQKELWELARQWTDGKENDLDRALAIRDALQNGYRYNLTVENPPDTVDFVAWFLLSEKEGYCTYFASAATMLCRMAGIPARYVTGFYAHLDENGQAVLTGERAHAWTEVYLRGAGWVTLDATPGYGNESGSGGEGQNKDAPTPTPTPTPSPAPENGATPTPAPEEEPSPEPESTPTPAPEDGATPPPDGEEPPRTDGNFPWWWLLALLIAAALTVWRVRVTRPDRAAAKRPAREADIFLRADLTLLSLMGVRRRPEETVREFAVRTDEKLPGCALGPLMDGLAARVYGNKPLDAGVCRTAYEQLCRQAPLWARVLTRARLALTLPEKKHSSRSGSGTRKKK